MLFQIKSHLQFLWHSSNQHGIHSPFVYTLVTRCFYDYKDKPEYFTLKEVFLKQKSSISLKNVKLLYRITDYFKPKRTLIIGVPDSISTFTIQSVNPSTTIIVLDSTEKSIILDYLNKNSEVFDFIYIENNFSKDNFQSIFNALSSRIHNDSILLLHPIYKSGIQQHIWNSILISPLIKVSINTYSFGLLFFRKEQEKENFIVRV